MLGQADPAGEPVSSGVTCAEYLGPRVLVVPISAQCPGPVSALRALLTRCGKTPAVFTVELEARNSTASDCDLGLSSHLSMNSFLSSAVAHLPDLDPACIGSFFWLMFPRLRTGGSSPGDVCTQPVSILGSLVLYAYERQCKQTTAARST